MKKLVQSCYRYHGQEHLLSVNRPVGIDRATIEVVNNEDGSVSVITDQAVVTFENRQNTEVWMNKCIQCVSGMFLKQKSVELMSTVYKISS